MSIIIGVHNLDGQPVGDDLIDVFNGVVLRASARASVLGGCGSSCVCVVGQPHFMYSYANDSAEVKGIRPLQPDWAVCDGRIDRTIADKDEQLAANGGAPESDARHVLAAYGLWGTECPNYLVGDYAFVVWDADRRRLVCVRDPMKFRPFYYVRTRSQLIWSSSPDALLTLATVSSEYDLAYFATYVEDCHYRSASTPWRDISRLRGGEMIVCESGDLQISRWYHLPPAGSLVYRSDEEYRQELRARLSRSVADRIKSSCTATIAFSGGMDSTAIAIEALQLVKSGTGTCTSLTGLTFSTQGVRESDESKHAQRIAEIIGLDNRVVPCSRKYCEDLPHVSHTMPEPNYLVSFWGMYEALANKCLDLSSTTMLTGIGGDEHFYTDLCFLGELWLQDKQAVLLNQLVHWYRKGFSAKYLFMAMLRGVKYAGMRLESGDRTKAWSKCRGERPPDGPDQAKWHPYYRTCYTNYMYCEQPLGEMSRVLFEPNGIQLRHPLWDRSIVEFAYAIPLDTKLSLAMPKPLLRTAYSSDIDPYATMRNVYLEAYMKDGLYDLWDALNRLLQDPPAIFDQVVDVDVLHGNLPLLRRRYQGLDLLPTVAAAFWLHARETSKLTVQNV